MMRSIQRRSNHVIHTCVGTEEVFLRSGFAGSNCAEQRATVSHDESSWLNTDLDGLAKILFPLSYNLFRPLV